MLLISTLWNSLVYCACWSGVAVRQKRPRQNFATASTSTEASMICASFGCFSAGVPGALMMATSRSPVDLTNAVAVAGAGWACTAPGRQNAASAKLPPAKVRNRRLLRWKRVKFRLICISFALVQRSGIHDVGFARNSGCRYSRGCGDRMLREPYGYRAGVVIPYGLDLRLPVLAVQAADGGIGVECGLLDLVQRVQHAFPLVDCIHARLAPAGRLHGDAGAY